MTESKPIEVVDWFGKWLDNGFSRELIEPSPEWIARQKEIQDEENKPKPPTPIESLAQDVEVVAEMVSTVLLDSEITKEDFLVLAETLSMIMVELEDVRTSMPLPGEV
jgi:hypothetical protein